MEFQTHPCGVEVTSVATGNESSISFQTHPCGVEVAAAGLLRHAKQLVSDAPLWG